MISRQSTTSIPHISAIRSRRASPSRRRSFREMRNWKSTRSRVTRLDKKGLSCPSCPSSPLHIEHPIHRAQRLHHPLEVFHVADFDRDVGAGAPVEISDVKHL